MGCVSLQACDCMCMFGPSGTCVCVSVRLMVWLCEAPFVLNISVCVCLQRCRWPVAHPVLCGPAHRASPAGVWVCCFGRVHSRGVGSPSFTFAWSQTPLSKTHEGAWSETLPCNTVCVLSGLVARNTVTPLLLFLSCLFRLCWDVAFWFIVWYKVKFTCFFS